MGRNDRRKEKAITGSGAEPQPEPNGDDYVKCVCTVCCADKGYHDVGDKVWIRRKLLENDAFIKAHFKAVDGVVADAGQDGQVQDQGEGQGEGREVNADGANGNGNGGSDNADGGSDNADGGSDNADGLDELELK